MKAALAQLEPASDPQADAGRVVEVVREFSGADLVAFPELFIGGYSTADPDGKALAPDDPLLAQILDACRETGTAAVVGFTERLSDREAFANSALCVDRDGTVVGIYRKTHLFGPAEVDAFSAGDSLLLVQLAGRSVGPMICYDVEFPEPARELAVAGAEVLLTISANMDPYGPDHVLSSRARALDNRRHHLYVNRVGDEAGFHFVGMTRVVGPDGSVIAELGQDEQAVLEVEFDPAEKDLTDETDYLAHIRPWLPVLSWEESQRFDQKAGEAG